MSNFVKVNVYTVKNERWAELIVNLDTVESMDSDIDRQKKRCADRGEVMCDKVKTILNTISDGAWACDKTIEEIFALPRLG